MFNRLITSFCGIKMPNPFMIASGPPSNTAAQVLRAFEAGWGGVVWKTIGVKIQNVSSRYAGLKDSNSELFGMNNIELISDRPLKENLTDIKLVKKEFPDRAVFVSIMAECKKDKWHSIVKNAEDTGCDGLELNLSCPHGLPESGLGSAIGQNPTLTGEVTSWVREATKLPILVKLTPNITDIRLPARSAISAGANGISLINTINSIISVDVENFIPTPKVAGKSTHGGYCGPAIRPIALYHLSRIAQDEKLTQPVNISGMGGIETWQNAVEFMLLGARTVQVCTAIMRNGYKIIDELIHGTIKWMKEKNFDSIEDFSGIALKNLLSFEKLDKSFKVVAHIDQKRCIQCEKCYYTCEDGCYQSIIREKTKKGVRFYVDEQKCVGCNMCHLVCPVDSCIKMRVKM